MTVASAQISDPTAARRAPAALLAGLLVILPAARGGDIPFSKCPPEVQSTILENAHEGKVDDIKRLQVEDRILYIVEIDHKGMRETKLHISGSGKLLKSVEELRPHDLPPAVRKALAAMFGERYRVDEVDKVVVEGTTHYRVEIDRPRQSELILTFAEDGSIASGK